MDNNQPTPGPTPLHELGEPLRHAVEQLRAEPVPPDALARALAKAEKIGKAGASSPALPRRPPLRWAFAGLAAAAAILVVVGSWTLVGRHGENMKTDPVGDRVAQAAPAAEYAAVPEAGSALRGHNLSRDMYKNRPLAEEAAPEPADPRADANDARLLRQRAKAAAPVDRVTIESESAGADIGRGEARGVVMPAAPPPPSAIPAPAGAALSAGGPIGGGAPAGGVGIGGRPTFANGQRDLQSRDAREEQELRSRAVNRLGMRREGGGKQLDAASPAPVAESDSKEGADLERAKSDRDEAKSLPAPAKAKQAAVARRSDAAPKDAKKTAEKPRVWHSRGGRPTFARVYVGDGNALELVSLDVRVTVEGPRARTVVDHIFRNPHGRQLEGTFEYPLPSGASPSYFAMFLGQTRPTVPPRFAQRGGRDAPLPADALAAISPEQMVRKVDTADWGRLQEARVVGKDKALETYEEVVRGRVDPALLEYAGGNTFRGRVFPIPPSGFNRVILAYEELLPVSQGKMVYRFPLPDRPLSSLHVTVQADAAECVGREFLPVGGTTQEAAGRVYWTRTWSEEAPQDAAVQFACTPALPEVQAVSGRRGENGPTYAYARVRPDLKRLAADKSAAAHAVFLLDTSLSEEGNRFGVSMQLLRRVLEGDPAIKQFNVVAFNAAAGWVEPEGWLPNTPEGRETLLKRLDGIVLEGATDVGAALDRLAEPPPGLPEKAPVDCFLLSDGHVTWGETDVAALVARFEARCPFAPRFHCYLTGLGAENAELYEALTRRGGGVFSCRSEADLAAAASAHRTQCLRVESVRFVGGPAASDVLVGGRRAAVYPGGELVVAGRFQGTGRTTLVVEGTFAGERFAQEYPVEVKDGGELAPRGWAEVAVASLLALNDPKLDPLVTAYCQQFNVGSRVASFLVLENEADYKRFNLEEERGKTVSGDLGRFLDRMWSSLAQAVTPREAFLRFLDRVENRPNLIPGATREQVRRLVSLMSDKEFELPAATLAGALLRRADVPPEYLANRAADPRDAAPYLAEARRRANTGDVDGAVRVLSSVIEEHPSRGDALRLVGYRLLDLRQPAQAAHLFERVQRQRPFEPHSYRDLARALEETGNVALAAVQYEIVLGSFWHNRFGESLKLVAQEEYARLMQDALRRRAVGPAVANYFGERLERMSSPQPKSDLRVTISWNTDATDVDLWVIEPDGTKCFYSHNRTKNGGELSQDQTQGYGPERYQVGKALKGRYRILVHYFNSNPNLLAGETHVNAVVTRFAGTQQEVTERHTVILRKKGEEAEVCDVEF